MTIRWQALQRRCGSTETYPVYFDERPFGSQNFYLEPGSIQSIEKEATPTPELLDYSDPLA